jgi:hypothetical protein
MKQITSYIVFFYFVFFLDVITSIFFFLNDHIREMLSQNYAKKLYLYYAFIFLGDSKNNYKYIIFNNNF